MRVDSTNSNNGARDFRHVARCVRKLTGYLLSEDTSIKLRSVRSGLSCPCRGGRGR